MPYSLEEAQNDVREALAKVQDARVRRDQAELAMVLAMASLPEGVKQGDPKIRAALDAEAAYYDANGEWLDARDEYEEARFEWTWWKYHG